MPLSLLLDENISPVVAEQIARKRPDIPVLSLHAWREGDLLGVPDHAVLTSACEEGRTLVTYDTQILSELAYWFEQEILFAGLIFVDDATIPGNDFGALVRALIYLWDQQQNMDWQNRLVFLPAPPKST
jgi:hypothetical protein